MTAEAPRLSARPPPRLPKAPDSPGQASQALTQKVFSAAALRPAAVRRPCAATGRESGQSADPGRVRAGDVAVGHWSASARRLPPPSPASHTASGTQAATASVRDGRDKGRRLFLETPGQSWPPLPRRRGRAEGNVGRKGKVFGSQSSVSRLRRVAGLQSRREGA